VWVFRDVSRRIFLGQLASHEVTFWQSRTIGNACVIAQDAGTSGAPRRADQRQNAGCAGA
jgi:hypothetical protein